MKNDVYLITTTLVTLWAFNCQGGVGKTLLSHAQEAEIELDEKALMITKIAVKSKRFDVDWNDFNFKDPADARRASHVQQVLDLYLTSLIYEKFEIKSALFQVNNPYDVDYLRACDEFEYYKKLSEDLNESWTQALLINAFKS